jgi:hypothetical protein
MTDPYGPAIEALERELAVTQALLEQLRQRAGVEPATLEEIRQRPKKVEPSPATTKAKQKSPPAPNNRKGGRPPLDPNDAERARKAAAMRKRRQRLREEAAQAAAAVAPEPDVEDADETLGHVVMPAEPSSDLRQRYSASSPERLNKNSQTVRQNSDRAGSNMTRKCRRYGTSFLMCRPARSSVMRLALSRSWAGRHF